MSERLLLFKHEEDAGTVRYRFGPTEAMDGLLQLDKETGDCHEMRSVPGDRAQETFLRAAMRVRECWRAGAFPDRADFTA